MSIDTGPAEVGSNLAEFAVELSQGIEQMSAELGRTDAQQLMHPGSDAAADSYFPAAPASSERGEVDSIIMDIPVTLKVVLGTAKMPVAAISKMTRGTVIKLDNRVGDPVDIYVNGRFLARGQVVVLDEGSSRFGVTLTQVGGLQGSKR